MMIKEEIFDLAARHVGSAWLAPARAEQTALHEVLPHPNLYNGLGVVTFLKKPKTTNGRTYRFAGVLERRL